VEGKKKEERRSLVWDEVERAWKRSSPGCSQQTSGKLKTRLVTQGAIVCFGGSAARQRLSARKVIVNGKNFFQDSRGVLRITRTYGKKKI